MKIEFLQVRTVSTLLSIYNNFLVLFFDYVVFKKNDLQWFLL